MPTTSGHDHEQANGDLAATSRAVRVFGVVQVAGGMLLALRPRRVAAAVAGPRGASAPGWLVRILGLRSVLQGAITAAAPTTDVLVGGALVDATHAASMIPFALGSRRYRRAAALSALAATAFAAVGALAAGAQRAPERTS